MKYLLLVLLFAGSCHSWRRHAFLRHDHKTPTSISIDNGRPPVLYSQFFDFERYIILDSTVMIGSISKVKAVGNRFYVGDFKNTRDVYCYDENGKLLWNCHLNEPAGRIDVSDFEVDAMSGVLRVVKGGMLYTYNDNGQLLETQSLPTRRAKVACFPSGNYALFEFSDNPKQLPTLALYDKNGAALAPGLPIYSDCPLPVFPIANLNATDSPGRYVFSAFANDTIFYADSTGLTPAYTLQCNSTVNQVADIPLERRNFTSLMEASAQGKLTIPADLVYETTRFLHFVYLKGGQYTSVYTDKTTGTVSLVNHNSDDMFAGALGHIPYGTLSGDRLIFVAEPFEMARINKPEQAPSNTLHPFLKSISAQTGSFSNPVLVIGKIKQINKENT